MLHTHVIDPVPCFPRHITAAATNLHALHRVFSSIHLKPQFQYLADTATFFMFSPHNHKWGWYVLGCISFIASASEGRKIPVEAHGRICRNRLLHSYFFTFFFDFSFIFERWTKWDSLLRPVLRDLGDFLVWKVVTVGSGIQKQYHSRSIWTQAVFVTNWLTRGSID